MAYETLKSIITQNIKTNGQESITGAILQQILLQMVDELGYTPEGDLATKEWVNTQLSDYASQTWVNNKLGDYLPLTGGTIKGISNDYKVNIFPNGISAQYSDSSLDTDTITEISSAGIYFKENDEEFIRIYKSNTQLRIQLEEGDYASLRAGSFIKSGGTADQVLCADGSVKTLAELKAALNAI